MEVLRIGGKGTDDNAHAIMTDTEGYMIARKKWTPTVQINKANIPFDAGAKSYKAALGIAEIGQYAVASVRVTNSTGVPVRMQLYADRNDSDSSALVDLNGNPFEVIIPAGTSNYFVSPNELPPLLYLDWLGFKIIPTEATAQAGNVKITVVARG